MFKGNKWEWSEVYALLRILADEKIYATDSETKEYTAGEMISIYINGEKIHYRNEKAKTAIRNKKIGFVRA